MNNINNNINIVLTKSFRNTVVVLLLLSTVDVKIKPFYYFFNLFFYIFNIELLTEQKIWNFFQQQIPLNSLYSSKHVSIS